MQTDMQTDRQADRQAGRQTDMRQTSREEVKRIVVFTSKRRDARKKSM